LRAIVTGAAGLVGRAVVAHFASMGVEVASFDHAALDISDASAVRAAFEKVQPEAVVNCAAWTDVDDCEFDRERAIKVNAHGPEALANACRRANAVLITISTDYVFDGEKDGFYTQRDQPNPQSVYAVSKLEGERRAHTSWARTIVVRTGYIFGPGGKNFLSTVIERGRRGERLAAIEDSFGTPTYARDLAERLYQLAELDLPGTYHVVNSGGGASFAEFSQAAFAAAGIDPNLLTNVKFASLKRLAPRPRNSRLQCLLSPAVGLKPLPFWGDALRHFALTQAATAMVGSGPV
jgi:dTDP-4-dehydrorhamnose reductase